MDSENGHLLKPWLMWEYDPCPEGGWSVRGFDTQEEAVAAAKFCHEEAEKRHQSMVEHCAKDGRIWKRSSDCYAGCVVTPGIVFRLDAEEDPKMDITPEWLSSVAKKAADEEKIADASKELKALNERQIKESIPKLRADLEALEKIRSKKSST